MGPGSANEFCHLGRNLPWLRRKATQTLVIVDSLLPLHFNRAVRCSQYLYWKPLAEKEYRSVGVAKDEKDGLALTCLVGRVRLPILVQNTRRAIHDAWRRGAESPG
jgi:hypothetical protein